MARSTTLAVAARGLRPMLASVAPDIPRGEHWVFEPKYDGIRILGFAMGGAAALFSRNALDKTEQFPEIAEALSALAARHKRGIVVDGEIVAMQDGSPARFQSLQSRMHVTDRIAIAAHRRDLPAALVVFDLLMDGDEPLVGEPWTVRRKRLEKLLSRPPAALRLSEVGTDGPRMLDEARSEGWEGIMAKKTDATYQPGQRTREWLKLKIEQRQEFVVGGYTEPRNSRAHFGAILLGYYGPDGRFVYAGHTGGGFSGATLTDMARRLAPLETDRCPFSVVPKTNERAHWVKPKVVVEVKFNEWTTEGKLRQPIFLGVRDDKRAGEVVREPVSPTAIDMGSRKRASAVGRKNSTGAAKKRSSAATRKKTAARTPAGRKSAATASTGRSGARGKPAEDKPASAKTTKGKSAGAKASASRSGGVRKTPRKAAGAKTAGASAGQGHVPRSPKLKGDFARIFDELLGIEFEGRGSGTLTLPTGTLDVTNLGKVFYPGTGQTKGDLMRHYVSVAPYLLPAMKDRPLVLKRFPNGIKGMAFYQQKAPAEAPESVRVEEVSDDGMTTQDRLIGGDLATLLYIVQLGAVSVDPWHSRVSDLGTADYSIIDLDPGPKANFRKVVDVAQWVKEVLDELGLRAVPKTSGASGIHIVLPLGPNTSNDAARVVAEIVATTVAERHPKEATVTRLVKERGASQVYVDFLQNIRGKTVAGVYSARANDGATVSTPLRWDEVTHDLSPADFTVDNVRARIDSVGDLWGETMKKPNRLQKLLER